MAFMVREKFWFAALISGLFSETETDSLLSEEEDGELYSVFFIFGEGGFINEIILACC